MNKIILEFTDDEFDYLSNLLNTCYLSLKKLPKNLRTDKFLILENILNNQFYLKK